MQTIMGLTEARDQALIERVRNGDEEAVTAIFNRYSDLIYNIALQVVGTPTRAQAAMQDVLSYLRRNPSYFEHPFRPLPAELAILTRKTARLIIETTALAPKSAA